WGTFSLVVVALLGALWPGATPGPRMRLTGLELPIVLFMAFCVLQLVPLPIGWLGKVAPGAVRLYTAESIGVLPPAPIAGPVAAETPLLSPASRATRPVSVNPEQTRGRLLLLASLTAVFFLVARWAREARLVTFLLSSITITAFVVALFGL